MPRYLVVANQTLQRAELRDERVLVLWRVLVRRRLILARARPFQRLPLLSRLGIHAVTLR